MLTSTDSERQAVDWFCWRLAKRLTAGMPVLSALAAERELEPAGALQSLIRSLYEEVLAGGSLATAVRDIEMLPLAIRQAIAVGEETGCLGEAMTEVLHRFQPNLS